MPCQFAHTRARSTIYYTYVGVLENETGVQLKYQAEVELNIVFNYSSGQRTAFHPSSTSMVSRSGKYSQMPKKSLADTPISWAFLDIRPNVYWFTPQAVVNDLHVPQVAAQVELGCPLRIACPRPSSHYDFVCL